MRTTITILCALAIGAAGCQSTSETSEISATVQAAIDQLVTVSEQTFAETGAYPANTDELQDAGLDVADELVINVVDDLEDEQGPCYAILDDVSSASWQPDDAAGVQPGDCNAR